MLVVVNAPCFEAAAHVGQRGELVSVQKLVPQPPVERLDVPDVGGLIGPGAVERDARAYAQSSSARLVNSVP